MGRTKLTSVDEAKSFFNEYDIRAEWISKIGTRDLDFFAGGKYHLDFAPDSEAYRRDGRGTKQCVNARLNAALSELDLTDKQTVNLFLNTPYDDYLKYRCRGASLRDADMIMHKEVAELIRDAISQANTSLLTTFYNSLFGSGQPSSKAAEATTEDKLTVSFSFHCNKY